MYVCMYIHAYICMRTCEGGVTCIHAYMHTYIRGYVYKYMYVCMYVCMYIRSRHIRGCIYTYICMYVCTYVHTYACIYGIEKPISRV